MDVRNREEEEQSGQSGQGALPASVGVQPWWRGPVFGAISPAVLTDSASKGNLANPKDGSLMQKDQNVQPALSSMPAVTPEYIGPHAQMEIGQSIACATYPYPDPFFAGVMTPYGTQALVHPQILGIPHTRMPLPLEMTEEPVYVNAKQYHGILRRRQSRAKAELEKKAVKGRKPYLHESRHQHAMRRARGCGGRFLNTKKNDGAPAKSDTEKSTASLGMHSSSSSGSEAPPSDCSVNPDSQASSKGQGLYQQQSGFVLSFHNNQSDKVDEGDCSGPRRGGILVNQPTNRAVAIQ